MTASTTPRLGLPLPSSSDNFLIEDFDNAFTTLDNTPGITPVANYAALAALNSTLTSAQHNSVFLQSDNGSLWHWRKPGAAAGSFRKINSVGMISYTGQSGTVTTSTTDPNSAPTLVSTTFPFPGGRWVVLFFSHHTVYNSGSFGYSIIDLWTNGVNNETSTMSGGAPNKAISHRLFQPINGFTPGQTMTIKATLRSSTYGGGTTSATATGQLYIFEI